MLNKFVSLIFILVAITNSAVAADEKLTVLGIELRNCYNREAFGYGQSSCYPPSELLPAIQSKCSAETKQVHAYIQAKDSKRMADEVLSDFIQDLERDAIATILDLQSINTTCTKN